MGLGSRIIKTLEESKNRKQSNHRHEDPEVSEAREAGRREGTLEAAKKQGHEQGRRQIENRGNGRGTQIISGMMVGLDTMMGDAPRGKGKSGKGGYNPQAFFDTFAYNPFAPQKKKTSNVRVTRVSRSGAVTITEPMEEKKKKERPYNPYENFGF